MREGERENCGGARSGRMLLGTEKKGGIFSAAAKGTLMQSVNTIESTEESRIARASS